MAVHVEKVQEYGLTEYEARAYLAMIELEEASAREVAEVSRVPRTKIYGVLEELHKKNLVEIIPERPKRFRPIPFDVYLERYESKFQDQLKRVRDDKKVFRQLFTDVPTTAAEGPGQFRAVKGRKNILNKTLELIGDAQHEAWALGSAFMPLRINYFSPLLHERVAAGLKVRLQCPVTRGNVLDVQESLAYGEVRHRASEATGTSIIVVDGSQALITHYIPDDTHLFKGEDVGIWTNDPAIVRDLRDMIGTMWQMGVPAADVIASLQRDEPRRPRAEAPRS